VSAGTKSWKTTVRAAVGLLLLIWIVHSIFVNEARTQARRGELFAPSGERVDWGSLSRPQQWRYGWIHGPPALAASLGSVEPSAFVAALALMGAMICVSAIRWRIALGAQGLELPLGQVFRFSLIAQGFNAVLLGTVGGDVVKAYYAARQTHHRKTEAVVTVFADRVIGLWGMLVFGGLMILPNYRLLLGPGLRTVVAILVATLVAASLFVFLAFRGGLSRAWTGARGWLLRLPKGDWLQRALDSCRVFGRTPWFVTRTLSLSMLVNILMVAQFYVLARGLHLAVPFLALALIVPVVICIAAVPISPSGLGVRENLFVHLLAIPAIAVPATPALSLSLLAYAASLAWSLLGGLVYLTLTDRPRAAELVAEEE
jgi:glycosyltransferase 2 family protein